MSFARRLVVASLVLGAGAVHAAETLSLKVDGFTSSNTHAVTSIYVNGYSGAADSGAFQVTTGTGDSFLAYCVEIAQGWGSGFQTYTVGNFAPATQKLLEGLFSSVSTYTGSAKVDTSAEYAALQLAVWELTHETLSTYSLTRNNGSFYVTDTSSAGLNLVSLANGYLSAAASWSGPSLVTVQKLSNSSYQDFVRVTPVPEPATAGLMALGLLGLAAVRRRQG